MYRNQIVKIFGNLYCCSGNKRRCRNDIYNLLDLITIISEEKMLSFRNSLGIFV